MTPFVIEKFEVYEVYAVLYSEAVSLVSPILPCRPSHPSNNVDDANWLQNDNKLSLRSTVGIITIAQIDSLGTVVSGTCDSED